jgi:hypothetical protein
MTTYVVKASGESDIRVSGPENNQEIYGWTCRDCIRMRDEDGNPTNVRLNLFQLEDHVLLLHQEAGDELWHPFVEMVVSCAATARTQLKTVRALRAEADRFLEESHG